MSQENILVNSLNYIYWENLIILTIFRCASTSRFHKFTNKQTDTQLNLTFLLTIPLMFKDTFAKHLKIWNKKQKMENKKGRTKNGKLKMKTHKWKNKKHAGAELGQAQLNLELDFTLIKICCIKLITRLTIDVLKWFSIRSPEVATHYQPPSITLQATSQPAFCHHFSFQAGCG